VTAPPVVMLNQATVDRFFPGQDPIGHQIAFWGTRWTVVGIVANERFQGVGNAAPIAAYAPLAQTRLGTLALVVKTTGEPESMASTVRSVIREIDPQLAVFGIEPLEETLANTLGEPRFMMQLLVLFAVVAAVLAAVGVHGVLTYVVAQRTREIGVRVTLGATAGGVTRLVVGQGLRLVLIGLAGGLAMTLVLSRGLAGLLFGVDALDPATLVTVVGVFGLVAAVSIWLPARRAVRLDPLVALRQD
jgi:putative ABC transport system permease protein